MKIYVNGILHEEDFAKNYEFIEKKLAELENKRIDSLEFDKEMNLNKSELNIIAKQELIDK